MLPCPVLPQASVSCAGSDLCGGGESTVCGGGVGIGSCCASPLRAGEATRSTVWAPRGARASLLSRRPSGPAADRGGHLLPAHTDLYGGRALRVGGQGRPFGLRSSHSALFLVAHRGSSCDRCPFLCFCFSVSAPFPPPPRAPPFDLVRPRECRHTQRRGFHGTDDELLDRQASSSASGRCPRIRQLSVGMAQDRGGQSSVVTERAFPLSCWTLFAGVRD